MAKMKFVVDVDGVLTTGQFLYSTQGKMFKVFGPHDADGFKMVKDKVDILLITADRRGFQISERRAMDMGYPVKLVPEGDRLEFIKKNFDLDNLIYMGDGIHDAPILKAAKFGIAPASARKEARAAAHFVTESRAAEGAVLDACQEILKRFFDAPKA